MRMLEMSLHHISLHTVVSLCHMECNEVCCGLDSKSYYEAGIDTRKDYYIIPMGERFTMPMAQNVI